MNYVRGEGRSYLAARTRSTPDLVPEPDSYSANAADAGAFVLRELPLYARSDDESLDHLAPDGIIAWHYGEFDFNAKPNRTAATSTRARGNCTNRGSRTPRNIMSRRHRHARRQHIVDGARKETPFTVEEITRSPRADHLPGSVLRFAPDDYPIETNVLSKLLTHQGRDRPVE